MSDGPIVQVEAPAIKVNLSDESSVRLRLLGRGVGASFAP